MVHLARDEQEMLDGKEGRAKQRAMEILVQYANALGAERFIDTNNVHLLIGFHPYPEVVTVEDGDELGRSVGGGSDALPAPGLQSMRSASHLPPRTRASRLAGSFCE